MELLLPKHVLVWIDSRRGELSRQAFIVNCLVKLREIEKMQRYIRTLGIEMKKKEDKEPSFIQLHHTILKQRHILSRCVFVDGDPEEVEITILDKVLFVYMRSRYVYFITKNGYYESYQQIADAVGVDKKTVTRFVQKWKTHGYIDYFNGGGNRLNYTKFDSIFDVTNASRELVPSHLLDIPVDMSGYIPDFTELDYEYERSIGLI